MEIVDVETARGRGFLQLFCREEFVVEMRGDGEL